MGWLEELRAEIRPGMKEKEIETVMARDHNMYTNTMMAILLMEIRDELKKMNSSKKKDK